MKQYSVKIKFPVNTIVRVPCHGDTCLNKTINIEAEDEESVKDEVLFAVYNNPFFTYRFDR